MTLSVSMIAIAGVGTSKEEPSPLFVEVCSKFFSDTSKYSALDKNGNDVTQRFYAQYVSEYKNGDYDLLMTAFLSELSAFRWDNETVVHPTSSRIIFNRTASQSFYGTAKSTHMPGKVVDFVYTISGDYAVSDGYNEILSYGTAVLDIDFADPGTLFSMEATNISTKATRNAAKTQVTFSASFNVNLSHQEKATGITLWTDKLGPFSNKVVGSV